ncbi:MAG: zinc dependent phospholipase C family protein, partial [Vibrio sp.]|nr:zinc dependent phospholipase C family protein [Vibrio sp.]
EKLQGRKRTNKELRIALGKYSTLGLLGSNSPDFPLLVGSKLWEEYLHGPTSAHVIRSALRVLPTLEIEPRRQCLAWFCGYLSHMVGDATIHPSVNLRVGSYNGHEEPHQECEVHMDVYIFPRLGVESATKCDFTRSIIAETCAEGNRLALNPMIKSFWSSIIQDSFPNEGLPVIDNWFSFYTEIVDKLAEEGDWFLIRLGAWVAGKSHLIQINPGEFERSYIENLPVPGGRNQSFDALFDKAVENTVATWLAFDAALRNPDSLSVPLSLDWNLNTGEIHAPNYLFW